MLNENYKAVQSENYQLRDYIINLQSRLLESQGEFPPPPSNVDGLHPGRAGQPSQHTRPSASVPASEMTAVNQLRASTEQAASDSAAVGAKVERMAPSETPYHSAESPRVKRARIGSHDMNAAQEALQGTAKNEGPLRVRNREDIVSSR